MSSCVAGAPSLVSGVASSLIEPVLLVGFIVAARIAMPNCSPALLSREAAGDTSGVLFELNGPRVTFQVESQVASADGLRCLGWSFPRIALAIA